MATHDGSFSSNIDEAPSGTMNHCFQANEEFILDYLLTQLEK